MSCSRTQHSDAGEAGTTASRSRVRHLTTESLCSLITLFILDSSLFRVYNLIVLSCQPRLTVTSCFVYKVITDLESIDHLCMNPIRRSDLSIHVSSSEVYTFVFYLAIVNKILRHCHS